MSGNGKLTDGELEAVQGDIRLAKGTAAAWRALVSDVKAGTGITITITSPAGGYRDLALQEDMYRNPGKYGATHGVASPGHSVHGTGRCVDIYNWASVGTAKLDGFAAKRGFSRTIAAEGWHYQHDGTTTAGGDYTAFDNKKEDDDMKDLLLLIQTPQTKDKSASDWWVQNLADHTYYHVQNITQLNYLRALGVREVSGQQAVEVLSGFKRI